MMASILCIAFKIITNNCSKKAEGKESDLEMSIDEMHITCSMNKDN